VLKIGFGSVKVNITAFQFCTELATVYSIKNLIAIYAMGVVKVTQIHTP